MQSLAIPPLLRSQFTNSLRRLQYAVRGRVRRALWTAIYRTTGRRLPATAVYHDCGVFSGDFEADSTVARRLIPSAFAIKESSPGRTTVTIAAISNRDIDTLAPYDELLISVPVKYHGTDTIDGIYPLSLPVTTEAARWGGVVTAGFPKFVADIEPRKTSDGMTASVSADGQQILTLAVDEVPTEPIDQYLRIFNLRDDGHVTESTDELTAVRGESDQPGGARLELGTHPLADLLRALDIGPESHGHAYTPEASATLRSPAVDHGPLVEVPADSRSSKTRVLKRPFT